MTPPYSDYPLSAFRSATGHLLGRLLFVLLALVLGVLFGSGVARLLGDHLDPAGALMLYSVLVIGGIAQVHGIFAYGFIFIVGAVYIIRDSPPIWLLVILTAQAIEAAVWCSSWTLGGVS